jgi:predicted DNA-binding transcriptional regulator AlpA
MIDLIELKQLAQEFKTLGLHSESTLRKIAGGHYGGRLDDFPSPIKLGTKTFWRKSDILAWIDCCAQKTAQELGEKRANAKASPSSIPAEIPVGAGRGAPTRRERQAAAEAGMTVRQWRQVMGVGGADRV